MARVDVVRLRAGYTGPHELRSTSDGKTLFLRRWDPPGPPSATVLIFHGITAYSGPYGPLIAEELARAGFRVYGMDLRGHGLSDGRRGDYPGAERLVRDLSETVAHVKSRSPKLVVLGHSLGVLSALLAAKNRPGDVDGLALLSAGLKIRTDPSHRPGTGAVLKMFVGAALLRGTPLFEYRRRGMLGLDDPLFNFWYSARFYSSFYGMGVLRLTRMLREGVLDSPNLHFGRKLGIPLFVGVGDQDELFSIGAARALFDSIEGDDRRFSVIPGARHAAFPHDSWHPLEEWLREKF